MPLHTPLEPAQVTQVFPDAPANAMVPDSVGALFKVKCREFRQQQAVWMWLVATMFVLGLLGMLASPIAGGIVAGLAAIAAIIILVVLHGRAGDAFWSAYAQARGFDHQEGYAPYPNVPLFEKGDESEWGHVLKGSIGGQAAQLALYTYTEVSHDSEGNRQESDYDWTTVSFRLPDAVAQRFRGLYCRPKGFSFGKLQDKLAHDRSVELESLEFNRKYSVRALDDQDDIALRELFSPVFIDALTNEFCTWWEQRGHDLVIYHKGHETEAADLDRMCMDAWRVLHRYLEEWQ